MLTSDEVKDFARECGADLFEPGHGPLFAPHVIDNARFPDDWFDQIAHKRSPAESDRYCASVLDRVLVNAARLVRDAPSADAVTPRRSAPPRRTHASGRTPGQTGRR